MAISGVNSMDNSLASLATSMQGGAFQQKIGVQILKNILDSQAMQGQELLKMISSGSSPTLDGTGKIVNIGA
jgi:hypothetical protein